MFQWFREVWTRENQYDDVRKASDRLLSMATNTMAWNMRRDETIERVVVMWIVVML